MKSLMGIELERGWRGELSWKAYGLRFAFGGLITAITGLIAHNFGPVVGGLFLAFPAILPASVTLIEDHDGVFAVRREHRSVGVEETQQRREQGLEEALQPRPSF